MNRQQAIEFIQALNMLQPHVAPLLFERITTTEAVRLIIAIANAKVLCELRPAEAEVESAT